MKRELKDCLSILKLLFRIARLRIEIRWLDRRNKRLRTRLAQLDPDPPKGCAVTSPQSNPPLVKIGPGGDYVREFYAGSMN